MTENDKNASKFKKIDYFGKSTQFFLLVHTVVSYGIGLGQGMASGCDRGLLRTTPPPESAIFGITAFKAKKSSGSRNFGINRLSLCSSEQM